MDSLELTIDSVARNFGTNDEAMSPAANNSQQSPPAVSKVNSPALILISSPKNQTQQQQQQTPIAEQLSQLASPSKNAKKTRKAQIKFLKAKLKASRRTLWLKMRRRRKSVAREKGNGRMASRLSDRLKSVARLQELIESRQTSAGNGCSCSKFDYTFDNQIRLRHRQIELVSENMPLSFDVLEKCQLSICGVNNPYSCAKLASNNGVSCAFCVVNGVENLHRCEVTNKSGLLSVNTQAEPFHHRQCYFGKHRHKKTSKVRLSKTVQIETNGGVSGKERGNAVFKEIEADEEEDEEEAMDEDEREAIKRRLDSDDEDAASQDLSSTDTEE